MTLASLATISAQATTAPAAPAGAAAPLAAAYQLFVPFVIRPPARPITPLAARGGVFPEGDINETHSPAVAIDANGGIHIAYARYAATIDNPPAYYAYCPGPAPKCVDPAAWTRVIFPGPVERAELALTRLGKPRLLYKTPINGGGSNYNYAECDGVCTNPGAWTIAPIAATAETDVSTMDAAHHEFALDPQGRPRFVFYTDSSLYLNLPRTLYYMSCDVGCTNPANWSQTDLHPSHNYDIFGHPVLAFTPDGKPRILTEHVTDAGPPTNMYYMACEADCTSIYTWLELPLLPRGNGINPSWDLVTTAQGGLRVAFYQGTSDSGGSARLFYLWCDADCMNQNSWYGQLLLDGDKGENPALKLNAQGQPRIAYNLPNGAGLGYLSCSAGCESNAGTWKNTVAESSNLLDATFPIGSPPGCDRVSWADATQSWLALDTADNAYVGYIAKRLLRCYSTDPQNPSLPPTSYVEHLNYARFTFFPQP